MGALVAFLASSVYVPGWSGAATSSRWAVLAIVPWLLRDQEQTAGHLWGRLFLLWAAVSMIWSPAPFDGINALALLLILAACFCFGSQTANLRSIWIGAALGLTISSVITVFQYYSVHVVNSNTPIAGLFVNGNWLAEATALVVVALVAERLWWLLPGLMPALLLPDARGPVLAVAVALAVHFRRQWRLLAPIAIGGLGLVLAYSWHKYGGGSTEERWMIWRSVIAGVVPFGHGIGSLLSVYPHYDLRVHPLSTPDQAHNEFLTVAFELGIPGLILFIGWCVTLAGPLDTVRIVLICLLVDGCFAFPLHTPTAAFLGMVAAGHAMRNRYLLRDFVVRRRGTGLSRMASARVPKEPAHAIIGSAHHAV